MAKAKTSVETLPQTYQTLLERVTNTLQLLHQKLGFDFLIISRTHNICVGTIEPPKSATKRTRVMSNFPRGMLTSYIAPLMDHLQPDELVTIDAKEFGLKTMQSGVSSRAAMIWGAGTYTCLQSKDKKSVELWRLPVGLDKSSLVDTHPTHLQQANTVNTVSTPNRLSRTITNWSLDD